MTEAMGPRMTLQILDDAIQAHGGGGVSDDFGLARFSPLSQYAGWPTPVLFVPGNHEYDTLDFD